MLKICISLFSFFILVNPLSTFAQRIFDVHIHGEPNAGEHLERLKAAGVYKAAVSTSWKLQSSYQSTKEIAFLQGLILACPEGKMPYSRQYCFEDRKELPDLTWVETLIQQKRIDFIGEVLSQYNGLSPSAEDLYPYYTLAEKYGLPVGIHTGLAGPNHGSKKFRVALGDPLLMEDMLLQFPKLKVWIMHSGAPYLEGTMAIMKYYHNVYADISAISNPRIFAPAEFRSLMQGFIDAGLEDRLMFGSDGGDLNEIVGNVNSLEFLTSRQKEKIFYQNAERFFARKTP